MTDFGVDEARAELREIVAALRAHVEWQQASGTMGFPRAVAQTRSAGVSPKSSSPTPPPGAAHRLPAATAPQQTQPDRSESSVGAVVPRTEVVPRTQGLEPSAPSQVAVGAVLPHAEREPVVPANPEPTPRNVAPSSPPVASPSGTESLDGTRRLEVLRERVRACTACRLHETRRNTVFARGTGSSRLCFVGEGPGEDEDAQGVPFVGLAGQLLDRMIAAMGIARDEVYICNIVKCRPPKNRAPSPDEMLACRHYLEEQLQELDPHVIVALGATAVRGLLGTSEGITRLRGKWRLYKGRIAVMPTFHPAYLLRNASAKREVWADLQAVLRQLGRPIPERKR